MAGNDNDDYDDARLSPDGGDTVGSGATGMDDFNSGVDFDDEHDLADTKPALRLMTATSEKFSPANHRRGNSLSPTRRFRGAGGSSSSTPSKKLASDSNELLSPRSKLTPLLGRCTVREALLYRTVACVFDDDLKSSRSLSAIGSYLKKHYPELYSLYVSMGRTKGLVKLDLALFRQTENRLHLLPNGQVLRKRGWIENLQPYIDHPSGSLNPPKGSFRIATGKHGSGSAGASSSSVSDFLTYKTGSSDNSTVASREYLMKHEANDGNMSSTGGNSMPYRSENQGQNSKLGDHKNHISPEEASALLRAKLQGRTVLGKSSSPRRSRSRSRSRNRNRSRSQDRDRDRDRGAPRDRRDTERNRSRTRSEQIRRRGDSRSMSPGASAFGKGAATGTMDRNRNAVADRSSQRANRSRSRSRSRSRDRDRARSRSRLRTSNQGGRLNRSRSRGGSRNRSRGRSRSRSRGRGKSRDRSRSRDKKINEEDDFASTVRGRSMAAAAATTATSSSGKRRSPSRDSALAVAARREREREQRERERENTKAIKREKELQENHVSSGSNGNNGNNSNSIGNSNTGNNYGITFSAPTTSSSTTQAPAPVIVSSLLLSDVHEPGDIYALPALDTSTRDLTDLVLQSIDREIFGVSSTSAIVSSPNIPSSTNNLKRKWDLSDDLLYLRDQKRSQASASKATISTESIAADKRSSLTEIGAGDSSLRKNKLKKPWRHDKFSSSSISLSSSASSLSSSVMPSPLMSSLSSAADAELSYIASPSTSLNPKLAMHLSKMGMENVDISNGLLLAHDSSSSAAAAGAHMIFRMDQIEPIQGVSHVAESVPLNNEIEEPATVATGPLTSNSSSSGDRTLSFEIDDVGDVSLAGKLPRVPRKLKRVSKNNIHDDSINQGDEIMIDDGMDRDDGIEMISHRQRNIVDADAQQTDTRTIGKIIRIRGSQNAGFSWPYHPLFALHHAVMPTKGPKTAYEIMSNSILQAIHAATTSVWTLERDPNDRRDRFVCRPLAPSDATTEVDAEIHEIDDNTEQDENKEHEDEQSDGDKNDQGDMNDENCNDDDRNEDQQIEFGNVEKDKKGMNDMNGEDGKNHTDDDNDVERKGIQKLHVDEINASENGEFENSHRDEIFVGQHIEQEQHPQDDQQLGQESISSLKHSGRSESKLLGWDLPATESKNDLSNASSIFKSPALRLLEVNNATHGNEMAEETAFQSSVDSVLESVSLTGLESASMDTTSNSSSTSSTPSMNISNNSIDVKIESILRNQNRREQKKYQPVPLLRPTSAAFMDLDPDIQVNELMNATLPTL